MNTRLYVGNLAPTATAKELRGSFSPHGNLAEVNLPAERGIGRPRGFGVITYENKLIDFVMPNMKRKKPSHQQTPKPVRALRPAAAAEANQHGIEFAPSPDEVARRAYFRYLDQGSLPGHDVQHWLEAEAYLVAERNLARAHDLHDRI